MIADGLFKKFPVDSIFGLHNFPGLPLGHFAVRSGPMLASIDTFEFRIFSEHSHPSLQHRVPDPILIASRIVQDAHTFKARYLDPAEPAVLTITQFQCGNPNDRQSVHVTPSEAVVRGTFLAFNDELRGMVETGLRRIVAHAAEAAEAKSSFLFERGYPPVINREPQTRFAVEVAQSIIGERCVEADMKPLMAAEDFAFMLREVPGCYILIGTGRGGATEAPCYLHNPNYDFNDDAIPIGMQYWVTLAERFLQTSR